MTPERLLFFTMLVLSVVTVSVVTTIKVIDGKREAKIERLQREQDASRIRMFAPLSPPASE